MCWQPNGTSRDHEENTHCVLAKSGLLTNAEAMAVDIFDFVLVYMNDWKFSVILISLIFGFRLIMVSIGLPYFP